jgi:hypothetical protein
MMSPRVLTRTDFLRHALEQSREWYEATGNAVFVWQGYQTARTLEATLPDWIARYLDGVAERILSPETTTPKAIASSLNLAPAGGGPSALARAKTARVHALIRAIVDRHRAAGSTVTGAIEHAALESHLSFDTVKEIYHRRTPKRRAGGKLP